MLESAGILHGFDITMSKQGAGFRVVLRRFDDGNPQ